MIGQVPAASALIFDIGVFALVVGATLLMLVALAHQSVRGAPRRRRERRPRRHGAVRTPVRGGGDG